MVTCVGNSLTLSAVVALGISRVLLPAVEANLLAVGAAAVVAELVVPRPTQRVTIAAVVVGRANHAIVVLQPGLGLLMDAVSPRVAGVQLVLGRQSAHESFFLADCKKRRAKLVVKSLLV